jgi:hypothetical protein
VIVGLGVFSHWALDFITHRPDLPLAPGSSLFFGLGLWGSFVGTIVVEGGLFLAGVVSYVRTTRPLDRTGSLSFWGLIAFLVITYLANLFGPPPPGSNALGYVGLSMWLFVAWGYWIDRHRTGRMW